MSKFGYYFIWISVRDIEYIVFSSSIIPDNDSSIQMEKLKAICIKLKALSVEASYEKVVKIYH